MFGLNKKTSDNNKKTHDSAKTLIEKFFEYFDEGSSNTTGLAGAFSEAETPDKAAEILRDLQQDMRMYMNRIIIFNQSLEPLAREFERNRS
jgi:hypothetical protein